MKRRNFLKLSAAALPAFGGCAYLSKGGERYSVAILGDTHFDTEPASVYHSHYKNEGKAEWLWKVQRQEFARNGEMWRERCRNLLAASARAAQSRTRFILQMGDIIQGDCDDYATHQKMLDDCIKMLRSPYPGSLPFLTVAGNHDYRGIGGHQAYYEFCEPFMSKELGKPVKYPAFSQIIGGDLYVFCDFETRNLKPIISEIESNPNVRHTFLVTHGPFTPGDDGSWQWRLGGDNNKCAKDRATLFELLLKRHAIVLSGHTHRVEWRVFKKDGVGSFAEFTANSVWCNPELATAEPVYAKAKDFGSVYRNGAGAEPANADRLKRFEQDIAFFTPYLQECFFNPGAGHFRMNVSDQSVTMDFYPGDASEIGRTFTLA